MHKHTGMSGWNGYVWRCGKGEFDVITLEKEKFINTERFWKDNWQKKRETEDAGVEVKNNVGKGKIRVKRKE